MSSFRLEDEFISPPSPLDNCPELTTATIEEDERWTKLERDTFYLLKALNMEVLFPIFKGIS